SEYLNNLLGGAIPYQWSHSPFETSAAGVTGIMNIPALFILLVLTLVLIKGMNESATLNAVIVFIKVAIVLVFITLGWKYINPANHTPYIIPEGTVGHESFFKHGYGGILAGAGVVFFAFIGFDA
ncbi:MAG TPA: amino acid permease, partial [Sphingobacteriaceae bacterium]|nr:amino acid permease [Sphingobacteriaceae bacterium]